MFLTLKCLVCCIACTLLLGNQIIAQQHLSAENKQNKSDGISTIIIISDTQGYSVSDKNAQVLQEVMAWIVDNRIARNIKCVVHVGDMTNNNTATQWKRIRDCFSLLDHKLPYIICEGNHDIKKTKGKYTDCMNQAFHISDNGFNYRSVSHFFEPYKLQNVCYTIKVNEEDMKFISLEYSPRKEVLQWANSLMKANAETSFFITVHDYLSEHSRLVSVDKQPLPVGKRAGANKHSSGEDIYQQLIAQNSNAEFLVCGHAGAVRLRQECELLTAVEKKAIARNSKYGNDKADFFKTFCYDPDIATGHRTDVHKGGCQSHQILFNAQWVKNAKGKGNGGDGWVLLMEFEPNNKSVQIKTYSPYVNKWRLGPEFSYELERTIVN